MANFNLAVDYRNEHFRVLINNYKGVNLHYQQQKVSSYISQFHLLNFSTVVGASFAYTTFDQTSLEESSYDSIFFVQNSLITPFVSVKYDNLDDAYFAKHGILAHVKGQYHFDLKDSGKKHFDLYYAFRFYITPGNRKFTIIPQIYGRFVTNSIYFNLWNLYGGELEGRHFEEQMPFVGLATVESTIDNASILRCDLRYNFYGKHYLTAIYNFMAPWSFIEISNSFHDFYQYGTQGVGLQYSYNSLLGPISLTANWASIEGFNRFGAYFSFGYTF